MSDIAISPQERSAKPWVDVTSRDYLSQCVTMIDGPSLLQERKNTECMVITDMRTLEVDWNNWPEDR